jgi:hypothetical protein
MTKTMKTEKTNQLITDLIYRLEKLRKQYGLSKKEMNVLIKKIDVGYKKLKKD